MLHKTWSSIEEVPYCFWRSSVKFQGHTALKSVAFDPDWAFPDCNSSLNSPMATKCCTKLEVALERCPIVFSCDQAALWMVFSVRLSVRLSVCPSVTPFWLCSHYRIIMKFSGVITRDQGSVRTNHSSGRPRRVKTAQGQVKLTHQSSDRTSANFV